jgi:RNA polymerase sigma-70 factor (ECF subfamily)
VTAAVLDAPPEAWDLVERAKTGDRDAFAVIWSETYDRTFRYILHRVRGRAVAEDLTSDVYERALRSIGRVEWQGRDIGAWLTTIARNRVLDYFGSAVFRTTLPMGVYYDPEDQVFDNWHFLDTDPAAPVGDQVAERDVQRIVLAAFASLTGPQKRVMVLRYLEELSIEEVASIMRLNVGAVKALTYRATRNLRALFPDGV